MNKKLISEDAKRIVDVIHSIVMVVLFNSMSLLNCKYTRKVKNDHAFNPVTTYYYIIVIHKLHLRFYVLMQILHVLNFADVY